MIETMTFMIGHNCIKNVAGIIVLVFCTLSEDALYLYHVWCNFLKGFQFVFWAEMILTLEFTKGYNSVKTVDEVTVLVFCQVS